jgi:integrase
MPYTIMRFEKRKGGPASALEKHHERKKEHYGSNPDIDRERSQLNYHLVQPRLKYYGEIQTRIEKAQKENPKCKVRKDSVKFIDTIVTASPEFFANLTPEQTRRYFDHALEFLKKEAVVRKALQYAVKNELITENVADKVDRPKRGKYLAGFYTKEELSDLFEVTKHDSMSAVIQLAAYYGLRRSEVLGIRWSSIDFDSGTISINHKVTEGKVDGKTTLFTEDKLKTKSSFRTLPLIPAMRELLLEQQKKQVEYQALFKSSYCQDFADYVCVDEMGKLFRPNYITDHFKLLLAQNHLRSIRFHDLRHSCASLLLAQGVPMKQIQDWLGHSTFATTADIYSHLDFNSKQASADAISAAFAPDKPEQSTEEEQVFTMTMSM